MNKTNFLILSILKSHNAISKIRGMTVKDILCMDNLPYKENTFYKLLRDMCAEGMIKVGAKEGRALTFYITETGIKRMEEAKEDEK